MGVVLVEKTKEKPVKFVKGMTFKEVIEEAKRKHENNQKLYKESNGMCINCKKNPGNKLSFICDKCQEKIDKIVAELRGPGFFEVGIRR